MEASEPHQDDKKIVRRKRKLHHGPSSLLRATIQEYGIYDKEVDAFRTTFLQLFGFLEAWQGNTSNKIIVAHSLMQTAGDSVGQTCGASGLLSFTPITRELCLEEELQVRLVRMTSIAKTLRNLCSKEREQKIVLYKEVSDCKEACLQLLTDMINHFHKETGILQHRLLEMDSNIEELEQEKSGIKQAYDEMVGHATRTVDGLEVELNKAEKDLKEVTDELKAMKTSYDVTEKDKNDLKTENEDLKKKLCDLESKVKGMEIKLSGSDMAREQYENLLEIALNKLRLFEDGELVARVPRSKFSNFDLSPFRQTPSGYTVTNNPDDLSEMHIQEMTSTPSATTRRRYASDNMSITSFETTISEMSMPIMSLTDSSRFLSDDRLSNYSLQSKFLFSPSPRVPPRRKHKKKQFFGKPFLKKSISNESQITNTSSTERLPTIEDEWYDRKGSLNNLSLSGSDNLSRNVLTDDSETKEPQKYSSMYDSRDNVSIQNSREKSVTIIDDRDYAEDKDAPRKALVKRSSSKKVQRTSSFAGLKSKKSGLVALAKDIEKRFKKKRRSKTADFSELNKINRDLEKDRYKFY